MHAFGYEDARVRSSCLLSFKFHLQILYVAIDRIQTPRARTNFIHIHSLAVVVSTSIATAGADTGAFASASFASFAKYLSVASFAGSYVDPGSSYRGAPFGGGGVHGVTTLHVTSARAESVVIAMDNVVVISSILLSVRSDASRRIAAHCVVALRRARADLSVTETIVVFVCVARIISSKKERECGVE
jgi:hypothetical protein